MSSRETLTIQKLLAKTDNPLPSPRNIDLFSKWIITPAPETLAEHADVFIDRFSRRELDTAKKFDEAGIETDQNTDVVWIRNNIDPRLVEVWQRCNYAAYVLQHLESGSLPEELTPYTLLENVWVTLPNLAHRVRRKEEQKGYQAEEIAEPFLARSTSPVIRQLDEDWHDEFIAYHKNPDGSFYNFRNNRSYKLSLPLRGILAFRKEDPFTPPDR